MAAYLLSSPRFKATNQITGVPLAGGKVFTYANLTTTPLASFTDYTGSTPNANPVILNSAGEADIWLSSAVYTIVLQDASGNVQWTENGVQGIGVAGAVATANEWIAFSNTATYISATSFSYAGDQTATFHVGRRIKTVNSGGTIYSTISASVFGGGNTTVTARNDSGVLDSGLSAVSYGIISYINPSYLDPRTYVEISGLSTTSIAGLTKLLFTTVTTDLLSEWSSNTFTAKKGGRYLLTLQLQIDNATNAVAPITYFYKNGSPIKNNFGPTIATGGASQGYVSVDSVNLASGDTVEFYFNSQSGTMTLNSVVPHASITRLI